jgi:hypothetical protein
MYESLWARQISAAPSGVCATALAIPAAPLCHEQLTVRARQAAVLDSRNRSWRERQRSLKALPPCYIGQHKSVRGKRCSAIPLKAPSTGSLWSMSSTSKQAFESSTSHRRGTFFLTGCRTLVMAYPSTPTWRSDIWFQLACTRFSVTWLGQWGMKNRVCWVT